MNQVQKYLFYRVLKSVLIIVGGLALLAILAQGLSQTELIIENRQSAFTYFYVIGLAAPQIMALLTPMAMFVAGVWALNRLHRDSEIVVAEAAGMTRWQIASPIMRLAVLGALVHLGINLWVQPTAQRAMRETVQEARADLVTSLVQPGAFKKLDDNLTVFARNQQGNYLIGVQIAERPGQADARDYLARRGRFIEIDGAPSMVMEQGEIHQLDENGALSILKFDQSTFDLSPFMREDYIVILKASDRYLHELFQIDYTDHQQVQDELKFFAEGHARLTTPIMSIAMALLAVIAVLGGNFSRRGYSRRITVSSAAALGLIILQLSAQSASADNKELNFLQWLVPLAAIAVLSYLFFYRGTRLKTVGVA